MSSSNPCRLNYAASEFSVTPSYFFPTRCHNTRRTQRDRERGRDRVSLLGFAKTLSRSLARSYDLFSVNLSRKKPPPWFCIGKCLREKPLRCPLGKTMTFTSTSLLTDDVARGCHVWAPRESARTDQTGGSGSGRQRVKTAGGCVGWRIFAGGRSSWPVPNGRPLSEGSVGTGRDREGTTGRGNSNTTLRVTRWISTRGRGRTISWTRITGAAISRAVTLPFRLRRSRRWIWGRTRRHSRKAHSDDF